MRRYILIATFLLMSSVPTIGQVFMTNEDIDNRTNYNEVENPFVPFPGGLQYDQSNYVPIGSGVVVLGILGGAYLIGRRKRK